MGCARFFIITARDISKRLKRRKHCSVQRILNYYYSVLTPAIIILAAEKIRWKCWRNIMTESGIYTLKIFRRKPRNRQKTSAGIILNRWERACFANWEKESSIFWQSKIF